MLMPRFSLIATLETIAVSALALFLLFSAHNFTYWMTVCLVAPLFLLHSGYSSKLAIRWFEQIHSLQHEWTAVLVERHNSSSSIKLKFVSKAAIALAYLMPVLCAPPIRFVAVLCGFWKHPSATLRRLPKNWFESVFKTRFLSPPEIVPGYNRRTLDCEFYQNKGISKSRYEFNSEFGFRLYRALAAALYVTSIAFRFATKGVAIMYLPIIWITSTGRVRRAQFHVTKDHYLTSSREKLGRAYSCVVIILMIIVPLALAASMETVKEILRTNPLAAYFFLSLDFDNLHQSPPIGSWHITRLLAAILTWVLFFEAERIENLKKNGVTYNVTRANFFFGSLENVRSLMSVWIIGCGVFVLLQRLDLAAIPQIVWIPRE